MKVCIICGIIRRNAYFSPSDPDGVCLYCTQDLKKYRRQQFDSKIKNRLRKDHCEICGDKGPEGPLVVHHILSLSCGGSNDPENLITLCKKCHAWAPFYKKHSDIHVLRKLWKKWKKDGKISESRFHSRFVIDLMKANVATMEDLYKKTKASSM